MNIQRTSTEAIVATSMISIWRLLSLSLPPLLLLLLSTSNSPAFEKLTEAQSLVYDSPHLESTTVGQQITYQYVATEKTADADEVAITDTVNLSVTKRYEDAKRDVSIAFLTEDRKMIMPDFTSFRGNPVIIAMLEHIAQSLGQATGGGALYFRNRIRDSLASDKTLISEGTTMAAGQSVTTKTISFSPFKGDTYLSRWPEYTGAEFKISLSTEAPGGLVSIEVISGTDGELNFERILKLQSTT